MRAQQKGHEAAFQQTGSGNAKFNADYTKSLYSWTQKSRQGIKGLVEPLNKAELREAAQEKAEKKGKDFGKMQAENQYQNLGGARRLLARRQLDDLLEMYELGLL